MGMLGFIFSRTSYAATAKTASDQANSDNSSESRDRKLQEIYDLIYNKLAYAKTDLTLNYLTEAKNYDTLSIDYKLADRHGCDIEIKENEDIKHTEKHAETDMTQCYLNDVYCKTVRINMSKIKSIQITQPVTGPSIPKIAYYNGDILNNCTYIDFKAVDRGNAFRLNQVKHVQEYVNSEHHENNKYKIDDVPKEIAHSVSTYSMCISDEKLAERLLRAFNDYLNVCRDQ